MRAVVQRVTHAAVRVGDAIVGEVNQPGLLVLLGVTHNDGASEAAAMARKIWQLRIMRAEQSASDLDAPILVISQFTLYADTGKGRRPSWSAAAPHGVSEPVYDSVCDELQALGARVEHGVFGAEMAVSSTNDGPVTILLEV